jgi:hypothetical protein
MYALVRNSHKYVDRDSRIEKTQHIEYDFLAPDSVNEIIHSLELFCKCTGTAYHKHIGNFHSVSAEEILATGKSLLEKNNSIVNELEILIEGVENSSRKVELIKVLRCYCIFKELIRYNAAIQLIEYIESNRINDIEQLFSDIPTVLTLKEWSNIGGQLIPRDEIQQFVKDIHTGEIQSWDNVHAFYLQQAKQYGHKKLIHALAALERVYSINWQNDAKFLVADLLKKSLDTKQWMSESIYSSRAKDHSNVYRRMVYDSTEEMNVVLGKIEDNSFIQQEKQSLELHKQKVHAIIDRLGLYEPLHNH